MDGLSGAVYGVKCLMRKRNRGFTLIELMIVVSIIGILASIAIPSFERLLLHSKRAELPLNLNAIAIAEIAYFSEWDLYTSCALAPTNVPGRIRVDFPPAVATNSGDWGRLGWLPDGKVIGQYGVTASGTTLSTATFTGNGYSDLDTDGNYAHYTVNPQQQPWMVTAQNIY